MKLYAVALLLLAFCISCKEKPANPVQKYGDVMMQSYDKGKQAGEVANLEVVQNAIRTHYAAQGSYPKSIEELKDLFAKDADLSKYDYNPQTGVIKLKD